MLPFKPDYRYQRFWRNFRLGRFDEACTVLEPLTGECVPQDREFYQGLQHVAASLHQLNLGDIQSADSKARMAGNGLKAFGSSYRGVQLQSLLMGLSSCLEDARQSLDENGRIASLRPRIPRVDLAFGLDPEGTSD